MENAKAAEAGAERNERSSLDPANAPESCRYGIPEGEEPLVVTVDRKRWLRGEGCEESRLLTQAPDGKGDELCCAGFAAKEAGVDEESLFDVLHVSDLRTETLENVHPALLRMAERTRDGMPVGDSEMALRIYHANDVLTGERPGPDCPESWGWSYPRSEAEREEGIRTLGRMLNIDFRFEG